LSIEKSGEKRDDSCLGWLTVTQCRQLVFLLLSNFYNNKTMSTWYYYDYLGVRQTVNSDTELRRLAELGTITPETIIETETGKTISANRINGLTFPAEPVPIPQPVVGEESERPSANPKKNKEIPIQLLICRAASILPGFGHLIMGCGLSTCVPECLIAFLKHTFIVFLISITNYAVMADDPKNVIALLPINLLSIPIYFFLLFGFIYLPLIKDVDKEYYYRFPK
jgi:hypothetical protein